MDISSIKENINCTTEPSTEQDSTKLESNSKENVAESIIEDSLEAKLNAEYEKNKALEEEVKNLKQKLNFTINKCNKRKKDRKILEHKLNKARQDLETMRIDNENKERKFINTLHNLSSRLKKNTAERMRLLHLQINGMKEQIHILQAKNERLEMEIDGYEPLYTEKPTDKTTNDTIEETFKDTIEKTMKDIIEKTMKDSLCQVDEFMDDNENLELSNVSTEVFVGLPEIDIDYYNEKKCESPSFETNTS